MREFSMSSTIAADEAENLTTPVWQNAAIAPGSVQFMRRGPVGDDRSVGWIEVTCREFRDEVTAVARGLVAAGIQPGERVGLLSRTRYEWTLLDYAILTVGAVTVPVFETSSAEQIAWILADSGAVACVVETAVHATLVDSVRDRLTDLQKLWQIEAGAVRQLVVLGEGVDPAEVACRREAVRSSSLATIIYTSGTTGRPKGCVLTHHNLQRDVLNALSVMPDLFGEHTSTLLFLPLAHSFARMIQIAVVQSRATMAHCADITDLVSELQDFRPTFVLSVPRFFEKVYDAARRNADAQGASRVFARAEQIAVAHSQARETRQGPSLVLRAQHAIFDKLVYRKLRAGLGGRCRDAISGGAPLGARLAHFYRGAGVTILEGYGLTETSPAATGNVHGATRIGTVGRPLPGVAVRIADDDEILLAGDLIFHSYWQNAAATAEAFTDDGWFRTGDLGRLDRDGYLTIVGRKKDIIVTAGGKNVAPAVLEERVRFHPLISHCVVLGDRQPFIAALVTIDEEAFLRWRRSAELPESGTVADLRGHEALRAEVQCAIDTANESVSKAEAIKAFRILPRDFAEDTGELTPSMKVKRATVHGMYAAEIADIYRG